MNPAPHKDPAAEQTSAHWVLDKKIPITLIFVLMANLAAMVSGWVRLDARVGVLEEFKTSQQARDREQAQADRADAAAVAARFDRVEAKLDRLIERLGEPTRR